MSLAQHLRGHAFSRLFQQVRQRLERDPGAPERGSTQLRASTPEEREAIEGLLGKRFAGKSLTIPLALLDEALLSGTGEGLVAWLVRLSGPLRDHPAEAAERVAAIDDALKHAHRSPLACDRWFLTWLDDLRNGTLTRLVGEDALERLHEAITVLEALPASDVPIALFASDNAGGTKALDGTPLERLCLRALAHWAQSPRPRTAEER